MKVINKVINKLSTGYQQLQKGRSGPLGGGIETKYHELSTILAALIIIIVIIIILKKII